MGRWCLDCDIVGSGQLEWAIGGAAMAAYYEIRVAGMLPVEVLLDFELLSAAPVPVETVLHGRLPDQAALAAFLTRLEDFGADVIEIRRLREVTRAGQPSGSDL
jgi:hypothetical protein